MSPALFPKHVAAVLKYQRDPLKALQMFNAVKKEDGFKHTLLTYKCMVDKLGFHGEFEAMEKVLLEMRLNVDNSLLEGVYIGCMKNYGRKQKVQEAIDVFERMDFYNCEPTFLSYNAIMNVLVEHGYFDQTHKVYMRMRDKGIVPDVYTFTIRIKSFCRTKRPRAALRLLKNMPMQGCEINAAAYCTVVGGFFEENHHIEAYELFDEMLDLGISPITTTFNKLLHILCKNGLCRKGALNEAISLLNGVAEEGMKPDVVTYNTLICGLCKSAKVAEAKIFLHKMVNEGLKPDGFAYNAVIDGYCKLGMIQNADKILNDAIFKGFIPDEFTYCSLINGLCRDGTILQALQLMNEMLGNGCSPSIWTYNVVINGLCKMGCVSDANNLLNDAILKVDNAVEILNQMWNYGVIPDVITYNSVLNGLCKTSKSEDVMGTFKTMMEKVMESWTELIICLEKWNKDTRKSHDFLLEKVEKGFLPSSTTFGRVINCL
ncbi:putative pentatricopeptide repeat-containing protein [Hibiscus syriacus]|uniref:Pentatricopeptide repeat-containing protein n=1 Tax=Hibiscus syriacus TaxID=106335 RepID=A0A6A3AU40_HIBSY|nr:putative pentatricopeptide repeat-containing protein [Hibiscus syriacus]